MAYQALYRKWRPQTFDEVRGQDAIVTTLKNQIKSDRIGHAYLFCGTRGTGKTSVAKIFARAVNCAHAKEHDGNPCNDCAVCRSILAASSMNVFEIDAASNNGVDNIRDIREQVEYPPTEGRYKVYIIDEVHMLSTGAFNALLKTLEEPPSYVIFILATTDPQKIPQTILSRCQRYDFRRISADTVAARIHELMEAEHLEIEERAVRYLARAADGALRDGLSLLDQCLAYHYGEKLTYEQVLDVLGAADPSVFSDLYRDILGGDVEAALRCVDDSVNAGREIGQFLTDFIWYLRNVLLCSGTEGAEDMLDAAPESMERLREDAKAAEKRELLSVLYALSELSNRMRFAAQKRVLLEVELIRLCTRKLMGTASAQGLAAGGALGESPRPTANAGGIRPKFPAESGQGSLPAESTGDGQNQNADAEREAEARARAQAEQTRRLTETARSMLNAPMSPKITIQGPLAEMAERAPEEDAAPTPCAATQAGDSEAARRQTSDAQMAGSLEQTEGSSKQAVSSADSPLPSLLAHWDKLVEQLNASNRAVFSGVVLKEEQNKLVIVFRNTINYRIAATNREENGLIRLRELAAQELGLSVSFAARIAKPGEFSDVQDRATEEELKRIHFPIDIEQ